MKISFEKLQLREPVKPPGKGQGGGAIPWFTRRDGFTIVLDTDAGLIALTKDDETRLVPVHLMLWADPLAPEVKRADPPKAQAKVPS